MLDRETTENLIEKAQSGDNDAKQTLISENSPLIKCVVKRFRGRGVEYDDLFQLGSIGMLKAIENFSKEKGVRFSTYAVPMIMGEIKRYLRDDGLIKVSRLTKTLSCKIAYFIEEYTRENDRSPEVNQIAEALGVEPQEVVFAMDSAKAPLSIYDKGEDDSGQSVLEKTPSEVDADDDLDRIIVRDAIRGLSERERKIIIMRYYRDLTQSEIAKKLNVSQVQISRLETKIINKIKAGFN
mgnify:CR=1 FL=1